jgi:hypothetical protein
MPLRFARNEVKTKIALIPLSARRTPRRMADEITERLAGNRTAKAAGTGITGVFDPE